MTMTRTMTTKMTTMTTTVPRQLVMSEVAVNGDAVVGIDGGRDDDVNGDDGDGKTVLAATVAAGERTVLGAALPFPGAFSGTSFGSMPAHTTGRW
jgi:hypothetical protein